jgi:hypothetical protein
MCERAFFKRSGPLKGPKKSQPPLEGKIFIVHPFNWAALWVSPPKNNYIPQHLQNGYINSYEGRQYEHS